MSLDSTDKIKTKRSDKPTQSCQQTSGYRIVVILTSHGAHTVTAIGAMYLVS